MPPARPRPIVVLGCPRSGTTLLQVALSAHPRIALPPETWLLADAYRRRASFGDLARDEGRQRFTDWLLARRRVRDLGLTRGELAALVRQAPPTLGSLLAAVLQGYAARSGKPRWGDKRPSYYRDVALVRRLLPDAQFVHVVRDPRACLASLQRAPWYRRSDEDALSTWCMAVDLGQRWARRLGPQTWHEVQYEHLLLQPEDELRRLCAFLGEAFDPAMTHPEALAPSVVPQRKTWHDRTRTPLDPSRATAYRDELAPDLLALVSTVARDRLERYGYPVDPGRAPAAARRRYARVDALRRARLARLHLGDRLTDLRERAPVAALPPRLT